jgi:hypothetical protein
LKADFHQACRTKEPDLAGIHIRIVSLEFVDLITDEMMKQMVEIVPVGFLGKHANNGHGMPSLIYWAIENQIYDF